MEEESETLASIDEESDAEFILLKDLLEEMERENIPKSEFKEKHPWIYNHTISTKNIDIFDPKIFTDALGENNAIKHKKTKVKVTDVTRRPKSKNSKKLQKNPKFNNFPAENANNYDRNINTDTTEQLNHFLNKFKISGNDSTRNTEKADLSEEFLCFENKTTFCQEYIGMELYHHIDYIDPPIITEEKHDYGKKNKIREKDNNIKKKFINTKIKLLSQKRDASQKNIRNKLYNSRKIENDIKSRNKKYVEENDRGISRENSHEREKGNRNKYFLFPPFLSSEIVVNNPKYHLGTVKLNQFNKSIIIIPRQKDIKLVKIYGKTNLNRALDGDSVYFEILESGDKNPEILANKTSKRNDKKNKSNSLKLGRVVAIENRKRNSNKFIGQAKWDSSLNLYRMETGRSLCPFAYINPEDPNISEEKDVIYVTQFKDWPENFKYPLSEILFKYQKSDSEIDQESHYILIKNELIDFLVFDNDRKRVQASMDLPIESSRLDLTKECIFTIDPATACDLDDAVSFKRLDADRIQIGVHIADVSYFVIPESENESRAQTLCTSVYMVNRAYHMLPSSLSSDLCSLVPGKNRYTVSIIMTFNSEYKVTDKWIGRSVINSCAKLAYEDAQEIIKGKIPQNPSYNIFNGFSIKNLSENINEIFKVTKFLRNERFTTGGALKFDSPELWFNLSEDKLPISLIPHYLVEANNLIEELMLLANNIAAETIYCAYPENAVLRSHKSPTQTMPPYLEVLEKHGFKIDPSSAGNFSKSIEDLRKQTNSDIANTVVYFLSKPMLPANYVFSGTETEDGTLDFHHYGLNMDLYTHFTSPIRRYPDILVHRLLLSTVEKKDGLNEYLKDYKEILDLCNIRKRQAAYAGADSQRYFLWLYLKDKGPLECRASFIPAVECEKNSQDEIFLLPYCISLKYTGRRHLVQKYKYFNIFEIKIGATQIKEPYHDMFAPFSFDIS